MKQPSSPGRVLLTAAILVLAACGGVPEEPAQTPTAEEPTPATSAPPSSNTPSEEAGIGSEPALQRFVDQAIEDLAMRAAVEPEQITVVSAEAVVWPDASLGCPQPGMRYAQVPVDGALIQLEAAGRVYPYHTGGNQVEPFLCEQTGKPPRVTPDPRLTPSFDPET